MNELSDRLKQAIEFLLHNGIEKTEVAIAKKIGVPVSMLNESKNGRRTPTWGMLLSLCDAYPINFWWFRGEGEMTVGREREIALLKKISELEKRIEELSK